MENIHTVGILALIFILYYYFFIYNVTKVYYFYSETCPHCVKMKPQYNKAKKSINSNMMGIGYTFYDIDMADSNNKSIIDQYKVSGVPYLMKIDTNNKTSVYKNERTHQKIKEWIQKK